MFSPATLNDETTIPAWLDIYAMASSRRKAGQWAGRDRSRLRPQGRPASRSGAMPRHIFLSDDLMCPPQLVADVAEAIPDCDYVEIGSCGHLGYLERPDEVNSAIIEFLDKN
jgi:pimeloyl-ACP methyl ester carboxylesterase